MNRKGWMCILVVACCICAATGCGSRDKDKGFRTLTAEELETASYPLQTDETLTIWMRHNIGVVAQGNYDYQSYPRFYEREKRTGIKVKEIYESRLGMWSSLILCWTLPICRT